MATHHTKVEIGQPVPPEIEAGAEIVLKVQVSCPQGCDLCGAPVNVLAADEILGTGELTRSREAPNESSDLTLTAPGQVGEHVWTVLFPRREIDDAVHEESRLVVAFTTKSHESSMAVWDVPSPVVMNRSFTVKVGVKCSATCQLAGRLVEVCDDAGTRLGDGRLGDTPWPGTSGLYVAEVALVAPAAEGIPVWSARFAANEPGLPHDEASATFSFRTARPPDHRVRVHVTDRETNAPIEDVDVRLGVYRAMTDRQGRASLELPGGVYTLDAWKIGYETLPRPLEVRADLTIEVEASIAPDKSPDDDRVWM